MITKQKIGKVQFYLGILLFVITIISSVVLFKVTLTAFVNGVTNETGTWEEIDNNLVEGSPESEVIYGVMVSGLLTQGLVVRTFGYVFGACTLILLIMSIMLMLQGLANQAKK
jgi:hypothetical protein